MKRVLMVAALVALAGPVAASQCPMMAAQIEEAMATATLDEAGMAQVQALLDEGMALHEAGDHAASEAKLAEAMALLGIEPA